MMYHTHVYGATAFWLVTAETLPHLCPLMQEHNSQLERELRAARTMATVTPERCRVTQKTLQDEAKRCAPFPVHASTCTCTCTHTTPAAGHICSLRLLTVASAVVLL
jgi:hypothetical protein